MIIAQEAIARRLRQPLPHLLGVTAPGHRILLSNLMTMGLQGTKTLLAEVEARREVLTEEEAYSRLVPTQVHSRDGPHRNLHPQDKGLIFRHQRLLPTLKPKARLQGHRQQLRIRLRIKLKSNVPTLQ